MSTSEWGPKAHVGRAVALLKGGLMGAHAVALTAVGLWWIFASPRAGISAAFGAVLVLLFFTVGHSIQIIFHDLPVRKLLFVTLGGYGLRVTALGVLLAWILTRPRAAEWVNFDAVAATLIATVVGWIVGEILIFRTLRIPIYDTEYLPPDSGSGPI